MAFTLLEVVLAITILASLSATIYQVVTGSVQSAALLEENQKQNDRVRTLFEICRTTFQTFPGGGQATLEVIESEPMLQELTILGVPNALPIGANPSTKADTIISLREQPLDQENPGRGVLYTLAMSREEFSPPDDEYFGPGLRVEADGIGGSSNSRRYNGSIPENDYTADDEGRYWFPLLHNIRALEWGVYDPEEEDYVTEWDEDQERPKMIELNLLLEGWETPVRGVFLVADAPTNTKPTSADQNAQEGTEVENGGGNGNNNNGGGGGDRPNGGGDAGNGDGGGRTPGRELGNGGGRPEGGGGRPGGGGGRPEGGGGRPDGGGGRPGGDQGGGGRPGGGGGGGNSSPQDR